MRTISAILVLAGCCCCSAIPAELDDPSAFTLVVLPDTQYYCDTRLERSDEKWGHGDLRHYFFEQTQWVRDQRERLNIRFVLHEGDIVESDAPEEWAIAQKALSVLDDDDDEVHVPYCLCLGNHDIGFQQKDDNKDNPKFAVNRTTHFAHYFPRETFANRRDFGGTLDPHSLENAWFHFEGAPGLRFLILALEYNPRDRVLEWANDVVAQHPDHRVIVLTHSYLTVDGTRTTDNNKVASNKLHGNHGEQIWLKLVRNHANIFLVLCGHVGPEATLTSTGEHGNPVHQVLANYQEGDDGGESWLRYMVFQPRANQIGVYTYNPFLDEFRDRPSSRFDLEYLMTSEEQEEETEGVR